MSTDISGKKFGMLTVIKKTDKKQKSSFLWEFRCDCGEIVYLPASRVTSGSTKSCGCLVRHKSNTDDLSGRRYGKLTVIQKTANKPKGRYLWECQCDCGNVAFLPANALKTGNTSSCGCIQYKDARKADYTGQKFEKLTVIRRYKNYAKWECQCDCGGKITVPSCRLKHGTAKSCGCLQIENAIKNGKNSATHNMTNSRLYHIWTSMKMRCANKNSKDYKSYGKRGITFCREWNDFELFMDWALKNGYKEHLTLERIDVDGNYEPSNCKWITVKQQSYNKRTNRFIEYKGQKKTVAEWAKIIGISRQGLRYRLEAGWNINDLLSEPDQGKPRKEKNHINYE